MLDQRLISLFFISASLAAAGTGSGDPSNNDDMYLDELQRILGRTGKSLLSQGNVSDAERAFRTIVRVDPGLRNARYALGQCMMKDCRFADAAHHFSLATPAYEESQAVQGDFRPSIMAQHGVALLAIAKVTDDEERREANIRDAVRTISSAVNARDKIRPGSYFDLFVKSLGEDNIRYFGELAVAGPDEQRTMLSHPIGGACSRISVERGRAALERGDLVAAVRYSDAARRLTKIDEETSKAYGLMRDALQEERRGAASKQGSDPDVWPTPVPGREVFFSQVGQDQWLWRNVFNRGIQGRRGVFVEAGAVDGLANSNTLFFERSLGWEGLLVEPHPAQFQQIARNRPRSRSVNVAGGGASSRGSMSFLVGGDMSGERCIQRGGLADGMSERAKVQLERDCGRVVSVEVEVVPFGEVLVQNGIKHVDALFIDMEGYEPAAIESIDFGRVSVTALCIENNEEPRGAGRVRRFLESRGYRLVKSLNQDDIYVSSKARI